MPSPTAVSELIRQKKETKRGKARKKANAKRGTVNYYTAFPKPPLEIKKAS